MLALKPIPPLVEGRDPPNGVEGVSGRYEALLARVPGRAKSGLGASLSEVSLAAVVGALNTVGFAASTSILFSLPNPVLLIENVSENVPESAVLDRSRRREFLASRGVRVSRCWSFSVLG